ncbi:MAG: uroporphyrinogen-III C-methyltransferase [Candidatus Sumerlaeia bacterium]|nr:uroporphyrinogen-III C-methyltransferase [Candidatus Sumerlaeia bacterium]
MGGKVYLVGAGPGDPRLLTLRGKELIERADALLYDALIGTQLLHWAGEECEKIFVGKRAGAQAMAQEEINATLVRLARAGKRVVRLKGGDPYVFGRGGEEAQACRAAGVDFEVVPGVSSAIAAPASAGIPVLFRDVAGSVLILHGRLRERVAAEAAEPPPAEEAPRGRIVVRHHRRRADEPAELRVPARSSGPEVEIAAAGGVVEPEAADGDYDAGSLSVDWSAVCAAADTLVILMGMGRLEQIRDGLLKGGRPADQPVAVVQWGSMPMQRTVVSTVARFPEAVAAVGLGSPGTIIVGEVVRLRETLNTFENLPLFGWRIGFAQGEGRLEGVAEALVEAGAQPLLIPCAWPAPIVQTDEEQETLLEELAAATHVVVTSPTLVEPFFRGLERCGLEGRRLLAGKRILTVTTEGAEAMRVHGLDAECVGVRMRGSTFERQFGRAVRGSRVVVLEREDDWFESVDDLEEAGAQIFSLVVADLAPLDAGIEKLVELRTRGGLDVVHFGSPGVVEVVRRHLGDDLFATTFRDAIIVVPDEATADMVEKGGLCVSVRNAAGDPEKLVRQLIHFRARLGAHGTIETYPPATGGEGAE